MEIVCKRCGLVNDYYTELNPNNNGLAAICNGCQCHIKFIPQDKPAEFYFGRHQGTKVKDCNEKWYLEWYLKKFNSNEKMNKAIQHRIKELN